MKYKLSEIFDSPISGEWGTELQEGQQGYKVIRTTNFTNQGRLNLSDIVSRNIDIDKCSKKVLQVGDIIIEKSGGSPNQPVGRVVFFDVTEDEYYFCNNFTAILRPKEFVYPKYGLYLMKMLYIQRKVLKFQNKTTGIINLKLNDYLNQTSINLPTFETQERIANILDQAQELIDKRKAQIEALDEIIQSVFYDMFGDPLINEKEWPRKCINEVVDYLKRGKSPKYVDYSNIRVINQKCIYWRKFIDSNCKYYNEDFEDKIKDQYLQDKDILINSTGTGTLGRAVVVNVKEDDKFVVDSHVTLMRVNLYCINPIFIATLFEFNNIQSEIYLKCVNGSTNQIELSVVKLGDYQVIIPPIELQNQFAEIVARIQKQKELLNKSLVELENNLNSLMERAFNGGPLR